MGFNSLQTGKCIQSLFQDRTELHVDEGVSIPFKRESVSKDRFQGGAVIKVDLGFNSLQTGKCIQRTDRPVSRSNRQGTRFQFPSNGKVYPKGKD